MLNRGQKLGTRLQTPLAAIGRRDVLRVLLGCASLLIVGYSAKSGRRPLLTAEASSNAYWNTNIPDECRQEMDRLASTGHNIGWVAFPPAGGNSWSVITDRTIFNRNIPPECHNTMVSFLNAGHRLLCVAFPRAGGNSWSFITDRTIFNRNIPPECHNKMTEFLNAGHRLLCVAFPPAGGNRWSVITAP